MAGRRAAFLATHKRVPNPPKSRKNSDAFAISAGPFFEIANFANTERTRHEIEKIGRTCNSEILLFFDLFRVIRG